jgi:hypothetical protein
LIFILDSPGVRAPVSLELRFDPIDRGAVSACSLPPVAEFGRAAMAAL